MIMMHSESTENLLRHGRSRATVVPLLVPGGGPLARRPTGGDVTALTPPARGRLLVTNEIREAAPRLRLVGAFPPRKHTTVAFTSTP
jgi:hypothetical protein